MPSKYAKSLAEQDIAGLNEQLNLKHKEYMNLRFRAAGGTLQQPHLLREAKKQIAVLQTLITAKRSGSNA